MKRIQKEAGWAWQPDEATQRAIARGNRTVARHKRKFDKEVNTMATRKKTTKRKVAAAPKRAGAKVIPLKELIRNSDLDPKIARRRLRAADIQGHDPKARWEFTPSQAKKAKEALGI